jgi:hypothetical protein
VSEIKSAPEQINNNTQPKALRIVAEIISFVFHPIFFPLIMAVAIYKLVPGIFMGVQNKQVGLWMISIAVTAVFFPLFSVALMKPLGFIESFKMKTARERTIPLMATMIFYFWVSHVFNSIPGNPPLALKVLLLGNFWGIILLFIINIFTKISMHTAAAGGMIGIIIVLMMTSHVNMTIPLFAALVLAGIIGTARMILGAHQRGDIWLGYIIGILVQLGAYLYMK